MIAISTTERIADYIRTRANRFFVGYTDEALIDYVLFHVGQGTLAHATGADETAGVMVGWAQVSPDPVPFDWQPHVPGGPFWYWHLFAADTPRTAMALADHFFIHHPECIVRPTITERNGRVRRYPPGAALAIYRKGIRYGRH
jgi:hypothetical protein